MTRVEDSFRTHAEALGLKETHELHARGLVNHVHVEIGIDSSLERIAASAEFRPALDVGLRLQYRVATGDEPARASVAWGKEGVEFLERLSNDISVEVDDGSIRIAMSYAEGATDLILRTANAAGRYAPVIGAVDVEALFRATQAMADVVHAMKSRAGKVPVAAPLEPYREATSRFAHERGLKFHHMPFLLFGNVPEAGILIALRRADDGKYRMSARLSPEGTGLKGITLSDTDHAGPDWVEVSGEDVEVKDEAFADRFVVRATDTDVATGALGPQFRAWLLGVSDRGASVRIAEETIELGNVELDPKRRDQVATQAAELLDIARELFAPRASPYR